MIPQKPLTFSLPYRCLFSIAYSATNKPFTMDFQALLTWTPLTRIPCLPLLPQTPPDVVYLCMKPKPSSSSFFPLWFTHFFFFSGTQLFIYSAKISILLSLKYLILLKLCHEKKNMLLFFTNLCLIDSERLLYIIFFFSSMEILSFFWSLPAVLWSFLLLFWCFLNPFSNEVLKI